MAIHRAHDLTNLWISCGVSLYGCHMRISRWLSQLVVMVTVQLIIVQYKAGIGHWHLCSSSSDKLITLT